MFKVNNKTLERRHWRRYGVFNVNFEHISTPCSSVSTGIMTRMIHSKFES